MIGRTARFTIRQGIEMGRPSLIEVSVIEGEPGVRVRGTASLIEDGEDRRPPSVG
jgi:predicted PhzF superfamily epimerase YddE/YHI9